MAMAYYAVVMLYPLIVGAYASVSSSEPLWPSIKGAFYLFGGWLLLYAGIMWAFLSMVRVLLPFWANFLLFSAGYFGIFLFRAYVQTSSRDIFASEPTLTIGKKE